MLHEEHKLKGKEEASASNEKVMVASHRYKKEAQTVTTVENMATSRESVGVLLSGITVKLTMLTSRKLMQQEKNVSCVKTTRNICVGGLVSKAGVLKADVLGSSFT